MIQTVTSNTADQIVQMSWLIRTSVNYLQQKQIFSQSGAHESQINIVEQKMDYFRNKSIRCAQVFPAN